MKKLLILTLLHSLQSNIIAQQLEWYETLNAKGPINQSTFPNCRLHNVNDKIVLSANTCAKSVGVEGTGQILQTGSDNSDAYFASFNDKGEIENSQIIYTSNSLEGMMV